MYDVFISCKSEDYPQAKGIYEFLNANGVNTFLASESLRKTGNTQYLNEIDAALDGCSNLIVFCTKADYADSKYVKEEWQSFRNEKLSGRKKGNILTIVGKGVKIEDLPYGLRGYEVIEFHNYKDILLSYVGETQQNFENKPTPQPTPQPKPKKNFNLKLLLVLIAAIVIGLGFALLSGTTKEQQKSADNAFFQNCSSIADYRAYLKKYPNGINKELAENKVKKHVADSTAKAKSEAERQRQIAAENERKAKEAEAERQRQIAVENERKAKEAEAERQRQIAAENERKAREEAAQFKGKSFTVNGVTFEMVAVKGGTFTMGASNGDTYAESDEKPTQSVMLSDYYIGKFEVTQELWQAVMGNNPSYFKGDKLPVEQVSWDDCQDFIRKLNQLTGANFRLPTEAEWEYAARGGNKGRGYKYSGSNDISDVAWYWENSGDRVLSGSWDNDKIKNNNCKTHQVGTKSPNELGIYDMSGNVYEWCQDWYGSYSSGSQTNPTGASSGSDRVERGGSYNNELICRVSYRSNDAPDRRYNNLGFRLAVSC